MTPEIKHRIGQIRRGEVPEGYVKKRKVVIPQQWGLPQIKDIASISSGSTPNRNNSEYWNGNIAWVTTGELSSGHVNHTSELITVKAAKETKMRIYPQGTLLMAMYGQGKTRDTVAILEIDAAVNQACAAITVKDGKSKFLFYQLKNSYQDIRKLSNTGNQENLNADIIKTYQVPWAPDEEQERMLSIQDGVDIYLRTKYLMDKDDPSKMIAAQIEIRNISATPLSLERYVFNGVERVISPYRLPPAVQFPDAYYYINLPSVNHMDYASFTLHFEDTTQRKWRVPGRAEFKSGTWELSWEKPQKI